MTATAESRGCTWSEEELHGILQVVAGVLYNLYHRLPCTENTAHAQHHSEPQEPSTLQLTTSEHFATKYRILGFQTDIEQYIPPSSRYW